MPNKLFIGCLPLKPEVTNNELTEHFSQFGRLSDVYIPKPYRYLVTKVQLCRCPWYFNLCAKNCHCMHKFHYACVPKLHYTCVLYPIAKVTKYSPACG